LQSRKEFFKIGGIGDNSDIVPVAIILDNCAWTAN